MHAETAERILSSPDRAHALIHADIPELDLAAATAADQLALAAALQMDVGDPLPVLAPDLDHRRGGLEALVVDAHGAVAEAGREDLALDLVGGQRCHA